MIKDHFGKTYQKIVAELDKKKGLAFLVIDPPNQEPKLAGKLAQIAESNNFGAIAIGGSVGAEGKLLEETLQEIKDNCKLPRVLFPGNISTLSANADAIYFMSMLNSTDPYYITGAQIASSSSIKRIKLEAIPTSYIIVEPGRAVGWMGKAKLIPRDVPYLAAITALAGQYMGAHWAILESGGGAPEPAPLEMISFTKKMIDIPLIVAGGVRTPDWAYKVIKAGADIIHIGAAIEATNGDLKKADSRISEFSKAVEKAAREK
ncbi:MAG: geranylgeranylglyceryl/heptaprenylglyceryl phosphate synthase [archaeon]